MRLYRLIAKVGQMKKRGYPWFDPPAPEAPKKYAGWFWDPEKSEWVETDVEDVTVEIKVPKYPEPTEPPIPAIPLHVPGWYWHGKAGEWQWMDLTVEEKYEGIQRQSKPKYPPGTGGPTEVKGWSWSKKYDEWVATIIIGEQIEFTPPRSLPPGVDVETVFAADPYFQLAFETAQKLVETGRWDLLQQGDAFWKLVYEVHKLCPEAKYPVHIAEGIFKARAVMHAKRTWLASEEAWKMRVNALDPGRTDYFGNTIVFLILAYVASMTGWLIGSIMERITFIDEDMYTLTEKVNTYLLGPENWMYSRHIGTSVKGRPYYSRCQEIGTEYVRHKRARWSGEFDIIDFPGGFVEKGYKFPYFVKYTWSHWLLEYVGFLANVGGDKYMLVESDYDPAARLPRGSTAPYEEWCQNFHWYL